MKFFFMWILDNMNKVKPDLNKGVSWLQVSLTINIWKGGIVLLYFRYPAYTFIIIILY